MIYVCKGCGENSPPCVIRCPGIDPYFCPGGDGSEIADWQRMDELTDAGREVLEAYEKADKEKMEQGA
jgi:predicted Fe-S protein YdhL (DUF1289 family)